MRYSFAGKYISTFLLMVLLLLPAPAFSADALPPADPPHILYVVPFLNVMIPDSVATPFFDSFIDEMMITGEQHDIEIRILKQDIDAVDKDWLAAQHFVTGELFDYTEESGCCSTEIMLKARTFRYRPGAVEPVAEIIVPAESFFNHDISTLEKERRVLGERLAATLSGRLFTDMLPER